MSRPIYVFIDESGNFDFSENGTNHYVMAAVIARDPIASSTVLQQLKYDLLAEGIDEPVFHASEDAQVVRDRVLAAINTVKSIDVHTVYIDKHRAAPSMQTAEKIYGLFGGAIAKYLLMSLSEVHYDQVIIVFDKVLNNRQLKAFLGEVKPKLHALGRPYRIYFQSVSYDFNGQIADYMAWARYVSLERGEMRPLAALNRINPTTFDLFRRGHTVYYPYKK